MPGIIRSVITRSGGQSRKTSQALLGIVGGAHVVSLRGERGAQHPRDLRFVVDHQNSSGHVVLLSPGRLHHCERIQPGTATGMIPVERNMNVLADSRQALRWLVATAAAALATYSAGLATAPTPPPRAWCFWCWWCGGRRRPGLASRSTSRFFARSVRLFLSASVSHASDWRAPSSGWR